MEGYQTLGPRKASHESPLGGSLPLHRGYFLGERRLASAGSSGVGRESGVGRGSRASRASGVGRGLTSRKSVKFRILFYFQKKGLYVLVDHVPIYYGASATVNPIETCTKGGNDRIFITLSDDLLLLL